MNHVNTPLGSSMLERYRKFGCLILYTMLFVGISAIGVNTFAVSENSTAQLQRELQEINDRAAGKFRGNTPVTVFSATPSLEILTGEAGCSKVDLTKETKERPRCVISRIGEGYYWASRNNTPLNRSESGIFVIFTAINGAGYIKILMPEMKPSQDVAALMGVSGKYDYVEHMSHMLGGVTYYGKVDEALSDVK